LIYTLLASVSTEKNSSGMWLFSLCEGWWFKHHLSGLAVERQFFILWFLKEALVVARVSTYGIGLLDARGCRENLIGGPEMTKPKLG